MIAAPASVAELSAILAAAAPRRERVESVNLAGLKRLIEYVPEDMTATVETGITLTALQEQIRTRGQWLAIDPASPETSTIADIINTNASGPRRCGYGVIRDYLIGLTAVLADGTVIHSGGKVVKNVAGYDLMKLFVGARGSLGVVVEAAFKLRPLPETEQFLSIDCNSLDHAGALIESIFKSEVTPVVLDLHRLSNQLAGPTLVLGFAGPREDVEWQVARVKEFGLTQQSSLDYETRFWAAPGRVHRQSVLPSKLIEHLRTVSGDFIARAANGIIYHRGAAVGVAPEVRVQELARRLKDTFDPNHVFPEMANEA